MLAVGWRQHVAVEAWISRGTTHSCQHVVQPDVLLIWLPAFHMSLALRRELLQELELSDLRDEGKEPLLDHK